MSSLSPLPALEMRSKDVRSDRVPTDTFSSSWMHFDQITFNLTDWISAVNANKLKERMEATAGCAVDSFQHLLAILHLTNRRIGNHN